MTRPSPAEKERIFAGIAEQYSEFEKRAEVFVKQFAKDYARLLAGLGRQARDTKQSLDLPASGPDIERHRHRKG